MERTVIVTSHDDALVAPIFQSCCSGWLAGLKAAAFASTT
jgi:hypothetical protein